ncbi:MAG: hypothetical protein JO288_13745 [Hyphomicrobiales bacterium]|nr:hypothetical protein [Hyphomicrobiales bacterium]
MTVEGKLSPGRAWPSARSLAGAALAAALMTSPAFAGCGSTAVSSGVRPPSTSTGVHSGATARSGSATSGSSCATGISNRTKLGAGAVHVSGGSPIAAGGLAHVHPTRQNFNFQGKPNLVTGSHRHKT